MSCSLRPVLLGVVAASVAVGAQQAPPAFRSRVDLVRLDVSVLDGNRRPVRGLTAADFTILEDGKAQRLETFSAIDIPDPVEPTAPWIDDVAPDVRTNEEVKDRRLFLIAIDDATVVPDPYALKNVKEIAHGVIDRLGATDLAAVMFSRDNRNSQDFTSDKSRLRAAVESFTVGFEVGGPIQQLWMLYAVTTLRNAIESFAELPDRRKTIVLISTGVPFSTAVAAKPISATPDQIPFAQATRQTQLTLKDRLMELFIAAQRANVNVYTIDPCGRRPVESDSPCNEDSDKIDYLAQIAAQTGGRPVLNTGDFTPGLDSMFVENGSYYLLAYQSTNPKRDGTLRQLQVGVNRPGVTVRTRSAYQTPRENDREELRRRAAPTEAALATLLPATDLRMTATAAAFRGGDPKKAAVAVVAGVRQALTAGDARRTEAVDLRVGAYNTDGKVFDTARARANVGLRANASGTAEYEIVTQLALRPGRYQVRIATTAGDPPQSGSVYLDVVVPDFEHEPVSMSDLVLDASNRPASAGTRLSVPLMPTAKRSFAAGDSVKAFARVYHGAGAAPSNATARWLLRDETDRIVWTRETTLGVEAFGASRSADVGVELPLIGFAEGSYLLTLQVTGAGRTVQRHSRFQVGSEVGRTSGRAGRESGETSRDLFAYARRRSGELRRNEASE